MRAAAYKSPQRSCPRLRPVMAVSALLASVLCTLVLPLLLFLVALRLWEVYMIRGKDPSCPCPLPPGSMGLPFIGETLQLILQVKQQLSFPWVVARSRILWTPGGN